MMKKRFISVALICCMMSSPLVRAEQALNGDSMGDANVAIPSAQQQLQDVIDNPALSPQIRVQAQKQLAILQMTPEQLERSVKASTPAVTLSVPVYTQETSYYCGPATTKQTMQYLTGKSDSQKTIAKALGTTTNGTDGTRIVSYLNAKQSKVRYSIFTKPTVNQLKSWQKNDFTPIYMGANMYTNRKPHIARLKFKTGGGWKYKTEGHFLNVSGYAANQANTRLTDPNIRRVIGTHSGHYPVSYTELHKATHDHFAKHYYA